MSSTTTIQPAQLKQRHPFLLYRPPRLEKSFHMSLQRPQPPSLFSLAIDTAVLHIQHLTNLSSIPDPIVAQLFQKTLAAGKLTDSVLRVFLATGNEDVLSTVRALNIQQTFNPVLPTRCHENF